MSIVLSQKRAVLLIHGLASGPGEFAPLEPVLQRQEFAISLPLLPGHGGDYTDLTRVTWHDWYSVVEQAYQALRAEYEQVAVVGRSLGGLLAALLASRERDIEACGLVAPALRWVSKATSLLDVPGVNALLIHGLRFMPRPADGINDPALQTASKIYQRYLLSHI